MITIFSAPASLQEPGRIPLWGEDGICAYALVDAEDYERIAQHRWMTRVGTGGQPYATRNAPRADRRRGRPTVIRMHRVVLGLAHDDRRSVDHISRDTLDNRKANLRVCTHAQNRQNTKGWDNATSKHRGVSWDKSREKWKAQGTLAGKNYLIGRFDSEREAADAAAAWRAANMPFSTD